MIKLSSEKQNELRDLFHHDGFPALMDLMNEISKASIERLVTYNSDGTQESERKIINEKLKHDGMIAMRNSILTYRQNLIKGETDERPATPSKRRS